MLERFVFTEQKKKNYYSLIAYQHFKYYKHNNNVIHFEALSKVNKNAEKLQGK